MSQWLEWALLCVWPKGGADVQSGHLPSEKEPVDCLLSHGSCAPANWFHKQRPCMYLPANCKKDFSIHKSTGGRPILSQSSLSVFPCHTHIQTKTAPPPTQKSLNHTPTTRNKHTKEATPPLAVHVQLYFQESDLPSLCSCLLL